MTLSADKLEEIVDVARTCLRSRIVVGDEGMTALYFAEALVQLADACLVGRACAKHGGAVHGKEAEELRAGIEQILRYDEGGGIHLTLLGMRRELIRLLDRVDARDSLAFLETAQNL